MDPELKQKEAKQKFKIIFISQLLQMLEVRGQYEANPETSSEMMDYIDKEIKIMLGKIVAQDEVEQRFEDMMDAIEDKKAEDPTYEVKHPLQLTVAFPTPEGIAQVAAEIQEKKDKELAREKARYLPT